MVKMNATIVPKNKTNPINVYGLILLCVTFRSHQRQDQVEVLKKILMVAQATLAKLGVCHTYIL